MTTIMTQQDSPSGIYPQVLKRTDLEEWRRQWKEHFYWEVEDLASSSKAPGYYMILQTTIIVSGSHNDVW